ncbi:hypothetical protein [Nocardioides antri]|uniref:hypothetical protein n=1 Tax=Nocardioides antri TaxID=2607659 RepID=UPI00165FAD62|nr:hypothetical protein [Nocardioides antri]
MSNTVIHEVKNRQTRTLIKIVQVRNAKDGYGWAAQCDDHGAQVKVNTRRLAHEAGRTPAAWCTACKKGVAPASAATKAPAKKTAAAPPKKAAPAKRAAAKKTAPAKKATTSRKK